MIEKTGVYNIVFFCHFLFPDFLRSNVVVIGSLSATTVALGLFLYLSNRQMSDLSSPASNGPGQVIAANRSLRIAIFVISTALIAACAIFSVVSIEGVLKLRVRQLQSKPMVKVSGFDCRSRIFL